MAAANSFHFNHNPSSDDHDKGAPSSSNNGRGLVQYPDQLPESNITPPPVAPGSSHAVISAENPPPTTTSATNYNVVDDGFSPTVPTLSDQANRISTTAAPSPSDAVLSTERPPPTSATTLSTVSTLPDQANMIIPAAENIKPAVAVDEDNMDSNQHRLTKKPPVLEIKEGKNPSQIEQNFLSSVSVENFTGLVSKGYNAAKYFFEDSSVKTRSFVESVGTAAANPFHFNYNPSSDDNDKGAPSSSNNGRGLAQNLDQLPQSNITPLMHAVISAEKPMPTTTSDTNYNVVDDGFSATVPTSSDQANRISTTAAPSPSDAVMSTERPPSTSTTSPSDAVMSTERPPSTSTTTINGSSPTDMSTERPPPTSATTLSTVSTLPDAANMIITAANNFKAALAAKNEDNMDSYLDLLTEDIGRLFEIKEGKNPSQIEQNLPSSESVKKLKDFFSEVINGINGVKDFFKDSSANALASDLLVGAGTAHFALAGLVGVAYFLEMSETRSANENESLRLMKRIYSLANQIRSLRHWPQFKQEMKNEIRKAAVLIVEGSILCCTNKITSPGLFSGPAKKAQLVKFEEELKHMEKSISCKINQTCPPPFNDSHPPAEMEKQIEEVTGLLKGERDGTALTVILHGHEGMGKTTLGNAVYAACSKRYKSFKYSKVTLFEDQDKTRTILKAQKLILRDLRGTKMIPEIRNHKDGQDLLHETLKEVAAFIFIDNNANLGENELSKLLPEDMGEAKNVRLLLTASNTNVGTAWPMKTPPKIHTMKYLSDKEAKSLLKRDIEEGLSDGQFTEIIEKCCGIPMMLMLVGKFIRAAPEKLEAYKQFIKDKDYETEPLYTMERYLLRYLFDHLPCICREPFLDICFFFRGWDWNTVEGIVGKQALDSLEARALLTKDSNGVVSVHNVILSLVKKKETETRFKLTNAGQIEELPEKDIKGIWVENEDTDLFRKLATKLNSMYKSLRVLKLGNSRGVDINCDKVFGKLIFFQGAVPRLPFKLKKCKELKYLSYQPTDSEFSEMLPLNLTHIEFDGSSNKHDFQIYFDNLQELRILKFIQFPNLRTLPDQLGDAVNGLQELTLSKCESIEELPQSITKLQSLKKINLHGCKNLKRLPRGFEKLSSLTLLDLSFCEKLLKLPHRIGYMEKLGKLSCNNCSSLTRIPESIGMNSFTKLDMSGCSSLRELPSLFVSLEKLISLNLSECSSLEKLPQGFGKLKCLVKLNLSKCSTLKQLCYDFHCLSSLEMLDLSQCERLEELPQNFDRLLRLKHLYLSFCYKLEGKWMKSLENMKTLRIINIKGSSLLKKGWQEILESRNQPCSFAEPCSFAVSMEDLPSAEEKENIQKRLLSKLDHFLIDKQGNFISSLPRGTTLLFMFHSDPDHDFPFPLIEEAIDDNQNGLDFKMFYIGKHFNKLHSKVKDNISGYSDDILEFGESWLSTLDANVRESWLKSYNAEEPIYLTRENESWTVLSKRKLEAFVFRHCEKYNELVKYLSKRPSEQSNLYLLRELFATREEEDVIFLKKYASDKDPAEHLIHRVDELKGKTILLEMGCEELCDDIGRSVLTKLYLSKEDSLKLEIISIPMVDSKVKVNERFSEKVPWLVLRNPLAIARAARYFLVADCGWTGDHLWYGSMFWIIEPDRTISICTPFMLFMLSMWPKPETFPQKIFEELPSKEWNRLNTVSDLEFLFSHLEHVSNQVKGIRKLKCIYVGNKKVTCSLRNASIELKDNIHIIYIPRYAHKKEMSRFTDSIYKNYNSWEKPKMQLEDEMDGMPLLNLSEDDSMRFWMRILFLKEEIEKRENINGIDNNGMMQVRQMKTLLHPFLLMEEEQSVVFMDEYGKMIATCRGDVMEWIFKEDGEDRAKRLIKQLVKASKVERESSIAVSMPAVPVAVQQENVNDLDNLSQYTSDLLEMVQLYQLLNFNKEGSESATPKVDRPVSIGFQRLNNFPFEGTSRIVQNINPEHPRGDILEILLERVPDEELAAAAVLVVADILERFKNISAECLILLEEMNRLSQYIKDLNGQPEKMRRATKWLVHCYIMCCAQIEPSKFATFFKGSVNGRKVLGLQQWLRRSQEELRKWKWAEAT